MQPGVVATLILIGCGVVCLAAVVFFHRRGGDGLFLRQLLLVNYFVSYILSGLAHVLYWSHSRGFYDAMAGSPPGESGRVVPAAIATAVGLLAVIAGLLYTSPPPAVRRESYSFGAEHPRTSIAIGAIVTMVTGAALVRVQGVAAQMDTARIIAVSGGEARFVILAGWLPWGVSLLALGLASRGVHRRVWWNAIVLAGAALVIASSLMWSGSRAHLLFATFPLLVVMLPLVGKLRTPLVILGAIALAVVVSAETLSRQTGPVTSQGLDVWSLVDWQWGRFSMIAWADHFTQVHGSLNGETFDRGFWAVPNAFLHFLRLGISIGGRSMVEITGSYFRGSSEQIFIVPGLTPELMANYGIVGVAIGYAILGLLSGRLADWFRDTRFEWTRLWLAYMATVVVFMAPVAQFEAFFQSIVTDSFPLVILMLVERFAHRQRVQKDEDRRPQTIRYVISPRTPTTIQHRPYVLQGAADRASQKATVTTARSRATTR